MAESGEKTTTAVNTPPAHATIVVRRKSSAGLLLGIGLMAAGQMLTGLELVDPFAISLTLCAIGVIGSAIVLSPRWGLTGIAFGMAASKLFTFWPIQLYVRRLFRSAPATLDRVENAAV